MESVSQVCAVVALAVGTVFCGAAFADGATAPQGRWTRTPTPDEITRCQPTATDIPDGPVLLRCRVARTGRLEACAVVQPADARLKTWGRCLANHFVAEPRQAGQAVSLPLQWRSRE